MWDLAEDQHSIELLAFVTLGPQLHDERPVRGQGRFVHRLERSGPLLHVRIDTARAAAVSVKNPKSSRKFGLRTTERGNRGPEVPREDRSRSRPLASRLLPALLLSSHCDS